MAACPCGSGASADACCAVFHAGAPAPTALALMRSRYTAYVRGEIDYLMATQDPSTRAGIDRDAVAARSREAQWLGLEIVDTARGGEADDEGIVEFVARGALHGAPFAQHERSRFRKLDGRWYYLDGKAAQARTTVTATAGRNDPCPCGSGKKFKKCHGA